MWEEILQIIREAFQSIALTGDDIFNILFSLLVALLLGLAISLVYRLTHRGVNFEMTFMTSLILITPIVAMVMFFIRGNLVLSLGLVGSLAIIRFRTPIKDTRDMVYLFWSIAVGLGAGTFNWAVVALSSLVIMIAAVLLYAIKYGRGQSQDYILVVSGDQGMDPKQINAILQRYASEVKIRSQSVNNDLWEMVFELRITKIEQPLADLISEVKALPDVTHVSLLAPQLALPA